MRPARDNLLTVLLERLDKLDADITSLREMVAGRMTAVEAEAEQGKHIRNQWFAQTWPEHLTEHQRMGARLGELEASKHRAEGAAWAGKLMWILVGAAAGLASYLAHYLLPH